MKLNFELVKKHPVTTGAVVIGGGLILYLLMSGGGSGGSSVAVVSGPSEGELQLAAMQYQTGAAMAAQNSQQQFQLAALQLQANTALDIEQERQAFQIAAQEREIALATFQSDIQGKLASKSLDLEGRALDNQMNMATLQAGLQRDALAFQTKQHEITQSALVDMAGIQAQSNLASLQTMAGVQLAGISAETARAQSTNDLQKFLAGVAADVRKNEVAHSAATAQIQAQSNERIAIASQKTEQKKSSNNLFGSIIGGIAGLFF